MKHETAIGILNEAIWLKQKQIAEFERGAADTPMEKAFNHGRVVRLRAEVAEIRAAIAALAGEYQRSEIRDQSESGKSEINNQQS